MNYLKDFNQPDATATTSHNFHHGRAWKRGRQSLRQAQGRSLQSPATCDQSYKNGSKRTVWDDKAQKLRIGA